MQNGFWINSVFANPTWDNNYFHWHRNFLASMAFLISQGFTDARIIVNDNLPQYKADSLEALGLSAAQLVPISHLDRDGLEVLVWTRGIDRHAGASPDFIRPSALRNLASRIKSAYNIVEAEATLKLYVRRGRVADRKIENEREVEKLLIESFGYTVIDPGEMSYESQVSVFARAKEVVAMHGGALTNSMFSSHARVLELTSMGHGMRPDFFPFVSAGGGKLSVVGLHPVDERNTVVVPLSLLETWVGGGQSLSNSAYIMETIGTRNKA